MPKQAAHLASAAETEQQFYEALQAGDLERLMACWSDDDDTFCVHPGGGRLVGVRAIRAAFEALFERGGVNVRPDYTRVIQLQDTAIHSVRERVLLKTEDGEATAWIIATNVYGKTPQGWRLLAHHASPGSPRESSDLEDPSANVLH